MEMMGIIKHRKKRQFADIYYIYDDVVRPTAIDATVFPSAPFAAHTYLFIKNGSWQLFLRKRQTSDGNKNDKSNSDTREALDEVAA